MIEKILNWFGYFKREVSGASLQAMYREENRRYTHCAHGVAFPSYDCPDCRKEAFETEAEHNREMRSAIHEEASQRFVDAGWLAWPNGLYWNGIPERRPEDNLPIEIIQDGWKKPITILVKENINPIMNAVGLWWRPGPTSTA
jgi:hypothetical protein